MVEPGIYIETSDTKALQHTYEAPPSSNTYIQSALKVISCKNLIELHMTNPVVYTQNTSYLNDH